MPRYRVQTSSGRTYEIDLSEGDDIDSAVAEIEQSEAPAPRDAGGGRGFINPPMAGQPQPKVTAPTPAPAPIDYGQAATDMMGTPMSAPQPGLIQSIGSALRPAPAPSVMAGYTPPQPSPQARQAELDRRLSYGAGPISADVVRDADTMRNARVTGNEARFRDPGYESITRRVAGAMDRAGELSSAQIVENTGRQSIRDAVADQKASEFRGVGEWAVDTLSSVAQGVVGWVQLPVNIIAPGSALADTLRDTQKELQAQDSEVAQAFRDVLRRRVESEEGFLGKYVATVRELVTNPTMAINEGLKQLPMFLGVVGAARLGAAAGAGGVAAAGRVAPTVALSDAISGGAITAGARAAGVSVGGIGASMAMAGGDAAGNTYETLTDPRKTPLSEWAKNPDFQRLVESGKTEQEAVVEIATAKARMAALMAAPLGVLGFMGAEAAVAGRGLGRAAAEAATVKGAAKMLGKDNITEQLEEGGTQIAGNLGVASVNQNQPLLQGVPEAMGTAAVLSTPFGALGAYSQYRESQRQQGAADPLTDAYARASLSTLNPDGSLISPEQTRRQATDIGPSAPVRGGIVNDVLSFTPPGSITEQAGLAPIVVPATPGATTNDLGGVNVGLPDIPGGLVGAGGASGGGDAFGGMGGAGRDPALAGGRGGDAAGLVAGDGAPALRGVGAAQPGPTLTAGRGDRATDADLLARAEQAAPQKIWAGRAGDGYSQTQDAQQALPKLQSRYPDLTWSLQQDADGKYYWAGSSQPAQGDANAAGGIAGAAGQGLAGATGSIDQGQQRPASAGLVDFGQAGDGRPAVAAGAATVGGTAPDEPAFTLKLAPRAPLKAAGQAITMLKSNRGVDVELYAGNLTDQQKVASAMARLVGKTVTYVAHAGGPANEMPNGFVLPSQEKNIYLDSNSDDGALFVMMHEGVHALPQPIREKLVTTIKGLTKQEMRADFAQQFGYDLNNDNLVDNEMAAFMTQAVSKREDFWQELRTKMGDGDFIEVAKVILDKLNTFITGARKEYGDDFLQRYATDAVAVRDAVSTAYADAMKAQGKPAPAVAGGPGLMASNSRVGLDFKDVVKRTPELQAAAAQVKSGEMTAAEYDRLVNEAKPVEPYKAVPAPASDADLRSALTADKTERIGMPSRTLKAGDPVGLRLDIPAYANHGKWVVSVHEQEAGFNAGRSIGYEPVAAATNVTFGVVEKAAMNIAAGKPKSTIAVIKGGWKPTTPAQAKLKADQALKSKEWVQVGMDPERHSYFYDRATMEPVISADEVVQVGPLVLAKNPTYGNKSDFMFSNRAADVNKLGMYSELARKLDAGPNQAPVDQWKAYIKGLPQKGVKPDEIEWSGVGDFLELKRAAGQKVTKAEVAEYLRQGGVQVEETVLGDNAPHNEFDSISDARKFMMDHHGQTRKEFDDDYEGWSDQQIIDSANDLFRDAYPDSAAPTKYSQYTLPGGTNYREVLLTLPQSAEAARLEQERDALNATSSRDPRYVDLTNRIKGAQYKSKHWDQPNVLAHIRMDDRVDADGNKVLFVEEIQSDWGQEGKKKGFAYGDWEAPYKEWERGLRERAKSFYLDAAETAEERAAAVRMGEKLAAREDLGSIATVMNERSQMAEAWAKATALRDQVPAAPFVTKTEGWLNLALKRVMVMAAEGGYDRVAFTTGEQNAERFSLDKRLREIAYEPAGDGKYEITATDLQGREVISEDEVGLDRIEELVGKEIAEKVARDEGERDAGGYREWRYLRGDNLKVEAKGMRAFYDTIVPTALKKLLPKVGGGQIGPVEIGDGANGNFWTDGPDDDGSWSLLEGEDGKVVESGLTQSAAEDAANQRNGVGFRQPGFDITPAMREKVATSGLPMFSNKAGSEDSQAQATAARQSRRGTEQIGEFDVRTMKDGTIVVYGDAEAIRAQIPEDVKGRVTKDGVLFTTSAAPRVKAALAGRRTAYSRGGAVLAKLPMKDGKYVGAPEKYNTPAKISLLRKSLRKLAKEGERGRFWYENSSREILRMTGGNVQEARKFVALLAIYSPQAKVDANSTFALRAWAQYKAGQPISVKTGVMDAKAQGAMDDVDAFWSGEKTGNFFFNLLREIDPSTVGKQGATIDMWMMRAGEYNSDAPTATQYAFMENETNRLAQELGWEPQQVQAAIWVAMKARMENAGVKKRTEAISEKNGWIRFDYPIKKGRPVKTRVILNAQQHRDNWLRQAFAHTPTAADTEQAKFDFSDGVRRHIGQISWEARPGRSTGVLPGVNDAPYEQQVEFQQAVQKALLDDDGIDLLAYKLGLLVDGPDILAPGVWQGEVAAGMQKLVATAPAKGDAGKTSIDPAQKQALETYAAVLGLLLRQEGIGYHRPFYNSTVAGANGVNIDIGRPLTQQEAQSLWGAVDQRMKEAGAPDWEGKSGMISAPTGIRLVNFGALSDNAKFHALVKSAAQTLPVDGVEVGLFASDGDMVTNNWKESPNGEDYRQRIAAARSPDLLGWTGSVLAPRVQSVFNEFSSRYGWGDPGAIQFSSRAGDGGGRADRAGPAPLPGAPVIQGATGPDPRIVAVAEQYARDNGIDLKRQAEYVQVDPKRAKRIANAYEVMRHAPENPKVKEAYENLIRQTTAQYRALEEAGYKFWFIDPENDPYKSPWDALRDLRSTQTMGVFPTAAGFGSAESDTGNQGNPMEAGTGMFWPYGSPDGELRPVLANDLFRAVHDAFGHGMEGAGFREQGEENAWQAHIRLFTGSAKGAITSETRGQNSWLNYGPYGERNRTAKVEDTIFADQKTGLMPEWTWTEGMAGDEPMFSNRAQTSTPEFKRWFGDSKVVDENGEPMVMYHGTARGGFTIFDRNKSTEWRQPSMDTVGSWFSNNPSDDTGAGLYARAGGNGDTIYPVYLSIKNPKKYRTFNDFLRHMHRAAGRPMPENAPGRGSTEELRNELMAEGYDGIEFEQTANESLMHDIQEMQDAVERAKQDEFSVRRADRLPYTQKRERLEQTLRSMRKELDEFGSSTEFDGQRVFVAFEPEQIKSATGNRGTFDPDSPDITASNRRVPVIGRSMTLPATGQVDAARIKLQDDALRMKRVIEAVKAQGGKVGERQNFYDANTLMPGRIQAAVDDFRANIVLPMLEKASGYGIDMDELALYAYAKHAEERNDYIASINPRMPDGGSGMTTADANAILQQVAQSGRQAQYDDLHGDLMAITSTTRQLLLNEGLITQDEFDAMTNAYQNYIPLRGWENVVEETGVARPGVGRGVNVRGKETIRALGRSSRAGGLIENALRDYERVVTRIEQNDVGKVLLDFVLSNPDPDLWGVDVVKRKASFNKAQGVVQFTAAVEKGENTIGVKVGGEQVYIELADPELARALRQAWKDETSGLERATLAITGWWNNWLRATLTRYNPAFAALNIPRDALWSGTSSALAELGPKGLASYLKNFPRALVAAGRKEAGIPGSSATAALYEQFRAAGGITGGFNLRTVDDIRKDLQRDLRMVGPRSRTYPLKAARFVLKALEFLGAASENATRFALYAAAREVGRSTTQAALLAKNGTTNFNRKGEWGGALNNLYLFFNAGVQGTTQLAKVLKSPAVQASMAGVAAVGGMLALYGASAGGEDDDGEAYWDKVPSYVKERNLVLMLPPGEALGDGIERVGKRGRYITLPVQYGFNIFPNMGYMVADVWRNSQDKARGVSPAKAAVHMASVVFGSVNPFGGSVDVTDGVQVLLAAMPTLIDLPVQIATERNAFGAPSSPAKSAFDTRPDSERMFLSLQGTAAQRIAERINALGGGNEAKAGKIMGVETSIAPGTIKTFIGATTGGLGMFVDQMADSFIAMSSDDQNLRAKSMPILNRFYGEVDEDATIRTAAERRRQVDELVQEVKRQRKVGIEPELDAEANRLIDLAGLQEQQQKLLAKLRKDEVEIVRSEMPEAEKKAERKRIQAERDRLAIEFNREFLQGMRQP